VLVVEQREPGTLLARSLRVHVHLHRLRDRLIAGDPGRARLRMGARAAGTTMVAAGTLALVAPALALPSIVVLLGASVSMTSSIVVTDDTPREQWITNLCLAPTAALAVILGTMLGHSGAGAAVMLLGTFVVVYARRWGARGTALGMSGFLAYFLALFFAFPTDMLAGAIFAVVVGVASSLLLRFVIVREKPESVAKSTLSAFEARARLLLDSVEDWLRAPKNSRRRRQRVRDALEAFEDTALELEDRLDQTSRSWSVRRCVARVELAVERIAEIGRRVRLHGDDAERAALLATFDDLSAAARGLRAYRGDDSRVLRVLEDVKQLREGFAAGDTEEQRAEPAPAPPPDIGLFARQALQATFAGLLSFAVGRAISDQRWAWAVLASLVVFNRSTTAGDTLLRAWHRVVGTALGITAGASLAIVLAGHRDAEIALMFVCVFLAFYFLRVSYAWSMVWMTALVALLYGVLGRFDTTLLVVRLEETIVGAGFGALAALLVLPERTEGRVRDGAVQILRGVAERLRGGAVSSRALERQLRTLREQVRPARRSPFVRARSTASIARHVSVLVYSARHLTQLRFDDRARGVADRQSALADSLADALENDELVSVAHRERMSAVAPEQRRVAHWLTRLDDALDALGDELAARASRA
jgi:uncharacterized membrane protein YccC